MGEPPLKKLRGGQRQRLQAMDSRVVEPKLEKDSSLASVLMEMWAWGELSPQKVQILASAAVKDFQKTTGHPPIDLSFLARLGTSGSHKIPSSTNL